VTNPPRLVARLFGVIAVIVALASGALIASSPAAAAPISEPIAASEARDTATEMSVPFVDDEFTDDEYTDRTLTESPYRTLNRWVGAANGFHTQFDGFVGTQMAEQTERIIVQGNEMAMGNLFYKISSDFTQFAVTLDVLNGIGSTIDGIVKMLLEALFSVTGSTGGVALFGVLLVLVMTITIFRTFGRGVAVMLRQTGAVALVAALVFGVGYSAMNYTPGSGEYDPAPATPGWFVKGVNDTIGWLAATPAAIFADGVETTVWGSNDTNQLGNGLGCTDYVRELDERFTNQTDLAVTNESTSKVAIANVMDSLWESTGLYVWTKTQAGYDNPYADKVYCRILDWRAGMSPAQQAYVTAGGLETSAGGSNAEMKAAITTNSATRAPFAPASNNAGTASVVAWAACKPVGFNGTDFTWEWEAGWEGFRGGIENWVTNPRGTEMTAANANESCQGWWNARQIIDTSGAAVQEQVIPDIFYISGDSGWIQDRASGAADSVAVQDFLTNLTGLSPWGGAAGTRAYVIGAGLSMLAFGFIDIVVIISKLFAAVFILGLWFVLIGSLFQPQQMKDQLTRTANKFLGAAIFASLTTLILTFVVIFTRALILIGGDLWGEGALGTMIWAGMAPITALILVHMMFTRVFKLPSPVSIRGATAWNKAGASGVIGAGVAAGVGAGVGSYVGSIASGEMRRGIRRAGRGVVRNALHGKKAGAVAGAASRSRMAPVGAAAKGAAGGLAVAGAAAAAAGAVAGKRTNPSTAEATFQAIKEQQARDKADLKAARSAYRAEHGSAAPGDVAGMIGDRARSYRGKIRDHAHTYGGTIAGALGITAVASEMATRKRARLATIEARNNPNAREVTAQQAAAGMTMAAARTGRILEGDDAALRRAAWDASSSAPKLTGNVHGARMSEARDLARTILSSASPTKDLAGGARTFSVPVSMTAATVQARRSATAPRAKEMSRAQSNAVVQQTRTAASRVASVLSAPADATMAMRRAGWGVQDAAKQTAEHFIGSSAVRSVVNDARVAAAAVAVGVDKARTSALAQSVAKAARSGEERRAANAELLRAWREHQDRTEKEQR